jgi:hypothetical protein
MAENTVFDAQGNFTAGFKYKISEYLRTIPLSDEQVESITKALAGIIKEALIADAARQKTVIEEVLVPLRNECMDLRKELENLESQVEAQQNQARGMIKLVKIAVCVLTLVGTLAAVFYQPKPDNTQAELLRTIVKELRESK